MVFLPHDTILGHTATENRENKLKMLWQTINYQKNLLMKSLLLLAELTSMLSGFNNEIIIGCGEE